MNRILVAIPRLLIDSYQGCQDSPGRDEQAAKVLEGVEREGIDKQVKSVE